MQNRSNESELYPILRGLPQAVAMIQGSPEYSLIGGAVKFYQSKIGVLVVADISGLPIPTDKCEGGIFAFHIHGGSECTGNSSDPFANAGAHYDTGERPHPYHSGDMPPLFGANGRAYLAFLTDRFTVDEIIGRTVIIHSGSDDFTSQPSGNAGAKIACGLISEVRRRDRFSFKQIKTRGAQV